jgi:hypothetical protein
MQLAERPPHAAEPVAGRPGADRLLLHAALPGSGPFRAVGDARLDGDYLLWIAHRHGMLPLVERALRDAPSHLVPGRIARQLTAHAATNARRRAVYLREASAAADALAARGRRALVLRSPSPRPPSTTSPASARSSRSSCSSRRPTTRPRSRSWPIAATGPSTGWRPAARPPSAAPAGCRRSTTRGSTSACTSTTA